jgi:heterodisulfide reductase subunit A-like polyferredoxin
MARTHSSSWEGASGTIRMRAAPRRTRSSTQGRAMSEKTVVIIGAGIAGLAAGCYGRMNGYRTRIVELHDKPGGLCTAWTRKGYTIDGCIHWLTGSSADDSLYRVWEELGAVQGRRMFKP